MARRGLTQEMRDASPWGLNKDLLETKKVITDPVHGDIFITELERQVIDSPGFQRLRRVRQLGATQLVYPGATHSRFAHSLGSLCVAQDLMDAVVEQELGPHSKTDDLFSEWLSESRETYVHRVAEATVLARLGGLLHDFTHISFGHAIEDDLGLLESHDANFDRFNYFWSSLAEDTREALATEGLHRFLRPLILSKFEHIDRSRRVRSYAEMVAAISGDAEKARQYEFVADIVGNTICADLLDYLRRDHLYTGLPLAVGQRYLAYFYVTPTKRHRQNTARMVLRIQRDGRPRADVVTELLKHLRYRYELSERALVHHAKLAADAMVGKVLVMWRDALWIELALARFDELPFGPGDDVGEVLGELEARFGAEEVETVKVAARAEMESQLRKRGDDGFLEWLLDWSAQPAAGAEATDSRRVAIGSLSASLLDRRLFKPIARIDEVPDPEALYDRYKDSEQRRRLEESAARFAEVRPRWQVVLWIPDPRMRLKMAEVIVDTGEGITTFVEHERKTRRGAGAEIYDAHRELWAVSVFVAEAVKADSKKVEAVLAWLASELEVRVVELGLGTEANPWDAPDLLAARWVLYDGEDYAALRGQEETLLSMLRELRRARELDPADTISGRVAEVTTAARAHSVVHDLLKLDEFLALRTREAELYRSVLATPGYEVGNQNAEALTLRFRRAAELKLETLT